MSIDQQFIDEMKQKLEEQKQSLTKELGTFAETSKKDPGGWQSKFEIIGTSEEDSAQEVEVYQRRRSLEDTFEKNLKDIDKALARIADSTYGVCKYCQQPIDEARLRARPESSACVACKKRLKGEG